MRLLVVDDDKALREQISRVLADQRYIVETAENGEQALDKLFDSPFDAVILDIMMPGLDGFEVIEQCRKAGLDVPILMLTAKNDTKDKVRGLDLGADDYLAKPFSLDELLARLRAILRRAAGRRDSVIKAVGLELDTARRRVYLHGKPVSLTHREFSILEFLLYNKNRAVSRFSLAEHVWGEDFDPFNMSNFVDVHIKNIRKKLAEKGGRRIVRTVRGIGYIVEDDER